MTRRLIEYIWSYNACGDEDSRSTWRLFLQIIAIVTRDLFDGMLTLRAMSLVYTTLLSIVPLLAVSISVLKGFGVHDQLEPSLTAFLAPMGERSAEISSMIVQFVDNMKIGVLGALGLGLLIFTVISLIQKIEAAFNYTWRLHGNRNLMQRFSNYLSLVLVGPVLVFSAVGITASLGSASILEAINELPYMSDVIRLAGKVVPYLLVIVAFTFIYILVPNTRVKPGSAFFGALIAGVLWESSGILFTSFIGGSTSYTAIYSGFAIMLMFMIWLYLSWLILLIGSSISFYHQHPERLKWHQSDYHLSARMREQITLQAMVNIGRFHEGLSELKPTIDALANYQRLPAEIMDRMLGVLEVDGLVCRSGDDLSCYLPARASSRIRLIDIMRSARRAEEDDQFAQFYSDEAVKSLLNEIENGYESRLGETTLEKFLTIDNKDNSGEISLV